MQALPPLAGRTLPGRLTKSHFGHGWLLAGLVALLGVRGSAWGQARATTGEPAFRLSRTPDLAVDERRFTRSDTLHMWARGPTARATLTGASEEPIGWWLLRGPTQSFSGVLLPHANGLVGSQSLAGVIEPAEDWSWSVSIEWKNQTVAFHTATLSIDGLARPRADFAPSTRTGELPLTVHFADRSQGGVTSWAWDFGDGTTSSEREPAHVYRTPGPHSVTLRVANAHGEDTLVLAGAIRGHAPDFVIRYGMNASENVWWQRGIAFADAMARASEFHRVANGSIGRELAPLVPLGHDPPLAGAGWPDFAALAPGEKVGARLFGTMAGSMPDGRTVPYVLTWAGRGACKLEGKAVLREESRTANRVEVFVDPMEGNGNALLLWVLDWSDPQDPVRDAHVWLPGMEAERPLLWPPFVEKLQAMNGGLGPSGWRAMDWNEVNQYGSGEFEFDLAGRILPGSPSQGTARGVCPEYQVALCNALGVDLHFNVPHRADRLSDEDYEAFLRDLFTRIRDGSPAVPGVNGGKPFAPLAPSLRVTVEYSNEIWNPLFPVRTWLRNRATAAGRTLEQEAALEIRRVFAIAEEVFSGPHAPRLRRYVGGWLGVPSFLREVLEALEPDVHVDAAGPACYFAPAETDVDGWLAGYEPGGECRNCPTPEEVLDSARAQIPELELRLREHRLIVADHVNPDGSRPCFELYEAGASFESGFQPWGLAAMQAQRLPAMYDAYVLDFVPALIAQGVDVVHWYSFITEGNQGLAGPFGHWQRMDQTITLPVPDVYVDEGVPKAAAIYRPPPRRTP